MKRDYPTYVKRYQCALSTPAMARWQNDEAHRQLAIKRSMQVIQGPWDTELSQVGGSRELTFLRDFWNHFFECIQSCQSLDFVLDISSKSMEIVEPAGYSAAVTFWIESYLNEVYIFQSRLLDFITFLQRRYKKDPDFTEFVNQVGDSLRKFVMEQLAPLVEHRGAHVHERRHRRIDPELVKLKLLDTMIDIFGQVGLNPAREQSRKDAAIWLAKQVRHYSDLAWHLFNEVCRGFSEGILLEIDRIIVPIHLKDNPHAFPESQPVP